MKKMLKKETEFLKLIPTDKPLVLDALDGSRTFAEEKKLFRYYSPVECSDKKCIATKKTLVAIYELKEVATFFKMFSSLDPKAEKFCLTEHQMINFLEKFGGLLTSDPKNETFFLYKATDTSFTTHLFVGRIQYEDKLWISQRKFSDLKLWWPMQSYDHCQQQAWEAKRYSPRIIIPLKN